MGDRTTTSRPAPPHYGKLFDKLMKYAAIMAKEVDLSKGFLLAPPGHPLLKLFPDGEGLQKFQNDMSNAGWLCGMPHFPMKFCVTEGGYIGMVPKYTEIGDVVCLLFGAQVLFL